MTTKRLFIPALFLVFLVGTMQIAYAVPQGEPFQDLQDEIDELKAAVAALQEKDIELMDADAAEAAARDAKDMLLMTANGNLGSDLAAVQADANTACDTIPVVKTGFGLLTGSTVIALDAFNVGIGVFNVGLGVFNDALLDVLDVFDDSVLVANTGKGVFNFALNEFNIALDGTFNIVDDLGDALVFGLNKFQVLDVFDVIPDIPNIPDIPSIPDIPPIPPATKMDAGELEPLVPDLALIDTTLIEAADDAVQSLELCA